MGNININIPDELHYDLKTWALKSQMSLKAVIIKILEDAIRKQGDMERGIVK